MSEQPNPQIQTETSYLPPNYQPYQRKKPVKSKVAAGVFGILLGGLGIHKFYLGKPRKEYCIFYFAGLSYPPLIGLIEGIIYLAKDDDDWAEMVGYKIVNY